MKAITHTHPKIDTHKQTFCIQFQGLRGPQPGYSCFRARVKVTEANIPLTCLYSLHTFLGSFCPAPNSECCEVHLNGSQEKRAQPPLQPRKAQRWHGSGGGQRVKTGRRMGATCPAALPTQKVTLGTLLKVKEALWGGEGVWFPSWATEGKAVWAMSSIPALPSYPQEP